jgi:hypothetical protein
MIRIQRDAARMALFSIVAYQMQHTEWSTARQGAHASPSFGLPETVQASNLPL